MRIILSPAKQMREDSDTFNVTTPQLLDKTHIILDRLKSMSYEELKAMWNCNEKIAKENYERLKYIDFKTNLSPAVLAYDGIAFKYMSPAVFTDSEYEYINNNLYILSGFYGALRPMDAVQPYRLEMQSKLSVNNKNSLYEFWGESIYNTVRDNDGIFINLASKEYSKCIETYLKKDDIFITCVFAQNVGGKLVQKATLAKMARGEAVRFLAENNASSPDVLKGFNRLGFEFSEELSTKTKYVFILEA